MNKLVSEGEYLVYASGKKRGAVLLVMVGILAIMGVMAFSFRAAIENSIKESKAGVSSSQERMAALATLEYSLSLYKMPSFREVLGRHDCPDTGWTFDIQLPASEKERQVKPYGQLPGMKYTELEGQYVYPAEYKYICTVYKPTGEPYLESVLGLPGGETSPAGSCDQPRDNKPKPFVLNLEPRIIEIKYLPSR